MSVFIKEEGMKSIVLALCVVMLTLVPMADAAVPYVVGDTVADFTLNDAYGAPVSLSDFEGTVIWVEFWTDT